MLQIGSKVRIVDNTTVKQVQCIKVARGRKLAGGVVGDMFKASVFKISREGKYTKGQLVDCLVVRTKRNSGPLSGPHIRFHETGGILIDKDGNPIGARLRGAVPFYLRAMGHGKVLSMAAGIVY